jgi:hypothetical protein
MWTNSRANKVLGFTRLVVGSCLLFLTVAVPELRAQNSDEFDSYKFLIASEGRK